MSFESSELAFQNFFNFDEQSNLYELIQPQEYDAKQECEVVSPSDTIDDEKKKQSVPQQIFQQKYELPLLDLPWEQNSLEQLCVFSPTDTIPNQKLKQPAQKQGAKLIEEASVLPKKKKKKVFRESDPNLLKNLIACLRVWVKIKDCEDIPYANKIWKYFMNAKKLNQKLLKLCFGVAEATVQQIEDMFVEETESLDIKSLDIFKAIKAQSYIREQAVIQLREGDLDYIIKNRRMKDKDQFKQYFNGRGFGSKPEILKGQGSRQKNLIYA